MILSNNLNDYLFLVGSGISSSVPTELPLGNELTRFILEASCGKDTAELVLDTWSKSESIIRSFNSNLIFPCPRLETICGCIYELDTILNRKTILKGFQSYSDVEPNENHIILASLMKSGANIITTNFDLGIENAFMQNHDTILPFEINGICGYKTNVGGSVFHLHGCSNNAIDKLGTTISNVKSGFSEEAKKLLIGLINNAKHVIVLGYGVVDTFDIIPLFQDERIKGEHIIYVKHSLGTQTSQKVEVPFYWNRLKINFVHNDFEINDTTKFLKDFATINGLSLNLNNPKGNKHSDWKQEFRSIWGCKYSKEDKLINFLAIRYQLGFNPKILESSCPNIIEQIEHISQKPIYNAPRIQAYFAMALKDFVFPKNKTVFKREDIVKSKVAFINKEYMLCLRDECDYYLDKYKDLSLKIDPEDMNRVDFIYNLLVDYSAYDYSKVQYISYIVACLKYKALLGARFKNENPIESCENELLLSLEISHFEGVLTALLHYIKAVVIYNTLNSIQDNYHLKLAVDTAYKLSDKTGCYFYKTIINNYLKENGICIN